MFSDNRCFVQSFKSKSLETKRQQASATNGAEFKAPNDVASDDEPEESQGEVSISA